MPKYLIEVPHDGTTTACVRTVELFLRTGSHFLTHADWGCKDGDHRAWIILEAENRDEARNVIPAVFRPQAKVVQLNAFTMTDIEGVLGSHQAQ